MGITIFHLGPIPIHVWGLFVAIAFIVGTWLANRRAPTFGVEPKDIVDFAAWCIVAAFIGARLVHVFLYEPGYYLANPGDIVKVWEGGLSSFGGFVGAIIAAVAFVRRRRIVWASFADTVVGALPIAYAIGRLGCHVTRMHPGPTCDGSFCFVFPDGVRRLDLGLLEVFLWVAIALALVMRGRHWYARPGMTTVAVIGLYGIGRFLLDFLRVDDARYVGLTPAQYGSLALIAVAVWLAQRVQRSSTV